MMTSPEQFRVTADHAGSRIDLFLADHFPNHSRSHLQKLIKRGHVLQNREPVKKKTHVEDGDIIQVDWPEEKPLTLDAEEIDLPIVHEDDDMLVINKPAGMVVHPGAGHREGTVVNALLGYDFESFMAMVDEEERPGIVHRLDKDTSGLLVVARNAGAKAKLSAAFSDRNVDKTYLAICDGQLPKHEIRLETGIARHHVHRKKMCVDPSGRLAISIFTSLSQATGASLVQADILTGRTHQIRVHLQHLLCPIVGDEVYGKRHPRYHAARQMLHAWKLALPHPRTGRRLEFTAPVPNDFQAVVDEIGLTLN